MRSRWCEPELGEGAISRLLESLRGYRAGGTRRGFRLPWAELTVVAGILVALVVILSQSGVPDQAVSLPLFQPTAIPGPEPVQASGGVFIDLSQTDDDSDMGFPSYPVSPQLSDDGRWLTFYYTGDEQQTGDRNGLPDLFRFDLDADEIEWVQSPARVGSHAFTFGQSADGSVLVFSANLSSVFGFVDYGSCGDGPCSGIALHDGNTRTDKWLFIPVDARQPEASSRYPYLTADGRFLAFSSNSPALAEQVGMECEFAAGDGWATYLFDRETRELEALPFCPGGVADSLLKVEVSFDGRYLLAERATNAQGTGASGLGPHFVLYDRVTSEYLALPSNGSEDQAEARILEAHFARGTNQVIFSSPVAGLSEGDLNSFVDLYVWDLENRMLELISV
ncbi:MAG: TolB family protein, partial [Anaerolineales bacterium]